MKKLLTRFQNSIQTLIKFLLYGGSMALFFFMLGIENRQVRVLSRTSVIMGVMYVIMAFALTRIYGSFDVGRRKNRTIVLAMELTLFFTAVGTYLVFLIMNVNDANGRVFRLTSIGFFLLSLVLQAILVILMVYIGNKFYLYVTPEEHTTVIIANVAEKANIERVIGSFRQRYVIENIVRYDDPDIKKLVKESDAVFFYDVPAGERTELVNYCYKHQINIYLNPDISDIVEMTSREMMFGDVPFLAHEARKMTFEQRIVKRLADIGISAFFLILLSPLFLISAALIHAEDKGSIFFRQKRATIHGRVFEIYKFRTMKENVENFSATSGDDRITKIGRFLRKYRIDELPQLLNIIRGDMSLVGPRPEMLENVSEYEREMPEFRYRLRMKAGLTGLAQIVGRYNTSSRDKLILDLMYIENFSLLLDIRLLFQTVLVLFNADDSTEGFSQDGDKENKC